MKLYQGCLCTFPLIELLNLCSCETLLGQPLGDLGTLNVDEKGEAFFSGMKEKLRIADLIRRSIVVYGSEEKSDPGVTASVIARSTGVGENTKAFALVMEPPYGKQVADFIVSKVDLITFFLSVLELNLVRKFTDAQNHKGSKDAHEAGFSATKGTQGHQLFPANYGICFEFVKLASKAILVILGLGCIQGHTGHFGIRQIDADLVVAQVEFFRLLVCPMIGMT